MLLLTDVRKKLLALWLGFSALLLLFFLLQALSGKYAGMETAAWLWIFVHLMPGLAFLLVVTLFHIKRGKAILRWAFWAVAAFVGLYLLFVLVSLAGISGGAGGQNLRDGFANTYRYLLPMQGLVLAVLGLLFFKKETLFLPDEKLLRGHAQELLSKATEAGSLDRRQAIDFFVAGDMSGMLGFVAEKIGGQEGAGHRLDEVLLLQNRLARLEREAGLGIVDDRDTRLEYNKVCLAALELTAEL
jgi:Effector-associated domain 11